MDKTIKININNNNNWKNALDTGNMNWSGGSWKEYWEKYSGEKWPEYCCREDCKKKPTDGAHVVQSNTKTMYIVPFCSDHNPRSKEPESSNPRFCIKINSILVNADDEEMDKQSKEEEKNEKNNDILKENSNYSAYLK